MILIALGSNITGPWGTPEQALCRAIATMPSLGIRPQRLSRLIRTAPFGNPNQPSFVNAVISVECHLPPAALLARLHTLERQAGRRRIQHWGPRTLDLDIIDWHGRVLARPGDQKRGLVLPHPGIAQRIFVLKPIAEIAPLWHHPLTHQTAAQMLRRLAAHRPGAEI
jgi:2-amino-4-hydroxy-6-hydroxymethyldihydropteridine diphosphokinase